MFGIQTIQPSNYVCYGTNAFPQEGMEMRVTGVELCDQFAFDAQPAQQDQRKRGYDEACGGDMVYFPLEEPTKKTCFMGDNQPSFDSLVGQPAPAPSPMEMFGDNLISNANNFDLVSFGNLEPMEETAAIMPCVALSAPPPPGEPAEFEHGVTTINCTPTLMSLETNYGPGNVKTEDMTVEPKPATRVRRPSDAVAEISVALQQLNEIANADPDAALQSGWHSTVESIRKQVADLSQRMTQLSNLPAINLSDSLDDPASPSLNTLSPANQRYVQATPTSVPTTLNRPPTIVLNGPTLDLEGAMEQVWYADRPYPAFRVALKDSSTNICPKSLRSAEVQVSLLDGENNECNDKLTGPASAQNFRFPLVNGVADIDGIRFGCVSSKFGGHFRVVVSLADSEDMAPVARPQVSSFTSPKIQVLSYRLFHSPKVDFEKLTPADSVSKMKGIGNLYAKRFAGQGICTVQQLAALDPSGEEGQRLLENLRRDRGALTLNKFNEYISQARGICQRFRDNSDEMTALLA